MYTRESDENVRALLIVLLVTFPPCTQLWQTDKPLRGPGPVVHHRQNAVVLLSQW